MADHDSEDEKPTVVEFADGSTGTLPSVAEYRRTGAQLDEQYAVFRDSEFGQALLNFDLSQP